MSSVLYYSNYCEHSKKLLQEIAKTEHTKEIHFICIDKRVKGANNKTYIVLENGQQIIMPENINRVPALLLLNQGFKVLYLEEILRHFRSKQQVVVKQATQNYLEPMAFSFGGGNAIVSDNYSFLDMDADTMAAKGNGGARQMHNYVDVNASFSIPTPTDDVDYKGSTKISSDITVEKLMQQRDQDIAIPPQQHRT
jgi:hypothetical protein